MRQARQRFEDTSSKAPLYKGTLWKLNADGKAEDDRQGVLLCTFLPFVEGKESNRVREATGKRVANCTVSKFWGI